MLRLYFALVLLLGLCGGWYAIYIVIRDHPIGCFQAYHPC